MMRVLALVALVLTLLPGARSVGPVLTVSSVTTYTCNSLSNTTNAVTQCSQCPSLDIPLPFPSPLTTTTCASLPEANTTGASVGSVRYSYVSGDWRNGTVTLYWSSSSTGCNASTMIGALTLASVLGCTTSNVSNVVQFAIINGTSIINDISAVTLTTTTNCTSNSSTCQAAPSASQCPLANSTVSQSVTGWNVSLSVTCPRQCDVRYATMIDALTSTCLNTITASTNTSDDRLCPCYSAGFYGLSASQCYGDDSVSIAYLSALKTNFSTYCNIPSLLYSSSSSSSSSSAGTSGSSSRSASSSSSTGSTATSTSGIDEGAIIGGVLGGIVGIFLLICILRLCMRYANKGTNIEKFRNQSNAANQSLKSQLEMESNQLKKKQDEDEEDDAEDDEDDYDEDDDDDGVDEKARSRV